MAAMEYGEGAGEGSAHHDNGNRRVCSSVSSACCVILAAPSELRSCCLFFVVLETMGAMWWVTPGAGYDPQQYCGLGG